VAKADFQFDLIRSYNFQVAGDQDLTEKSIRYYADLAIKFGAIKNKTVDDVVKSVWRPYDKLPKTPV